MWCEIFHRLTDDTNNTGRNKCPNKYCVYKHDDLMVVEKHKWYLCTFREHVCLRCKESVMGIKIVDHFLQRHCQVVQAVLCGRQATVHITDKLNVTKSSFSDYVFYLRKLMLWLTIERRTNEIVFWLIANTNLLAYKNFDVTYNIIYNNKCSYRRGNLSNDQFNDWYNCISLPGFKHYENIDIELKIVMKIKK